MFFQQIENNPGLIGTGITVHDNERLIFIYVIERYP